MKHLHTRVAINPVRITKENLTRVKEILGQETLDVSSVTNLLNKDFEIPFYQKVNASSDPFFFNADGKTIGIELWCDPEDPQNPSKMLGLYSSIVEDGEDGALVPYKLVRGSQSNGVFIYFFEGIGGLNAFTFFGKNGNHFGIAKYPILTIAECNMKGAFPYMRSEDLIEVGTEALEALHADITSGTGPTNIRKYYIEPPEGDQNIVRILKDRRLRAPFLAAHETDEASLEKSALTLGPTYNRINYAGIPILGDFLKPGENPFVSKEHHKLSEKSYAPSAGMTYFQGLTAYFDGPKAGTIRFHTQKDDTRPALILDEDFLTIMSLVFIENDSPLFGFDPLAKDRATKVKLPEPSDIHMCIKRWQPSWLGHTPLGQTLYITDRLLGDLASYPNSMKHIAKSDNHNMGIIQIAKGFYEGIDNTESKPRPSDAVSGGLRIHADHYQRYANFGGFAEGMSAISYYSTDATPRIRGWYEKDTSVYEEFDINDDRYSNGSYANFLTKNYNTLAGLLPVYDRYTQLLRMFFCLEELKGVDSFKIPQGLRDQLNQYVLEKKSLRTLGPKDLKVNFSHHYR